MESVTQEDRSGFTPPNSSPSPVPSSILCVCEAKMRGAVLGRHLRRSHRFRLGSPLWLPVLLVSGSREASRCQFWPQPCKSLGLGKSFITQHFFWWWCCCVTKSVQSATLFKEVWLQRQKRKTPLLLQIGSVYYFSSNVQPCHFLLIIVCLSFFSTWFAFNTIRLHLLSIKEEKTSIKIAPSVQNVGFRNRVDDSKIRVYLKIKLIQSFILFAIADSIGSSSRLIGGNTRHPAVASLRETCAAERQAGVPPRCGPAFITLFAALCRSFW